MTNNVNAEKQSVDVANNQADAVKDVDASHLQKAASNQVMAT